MPSTFPAELNELSIVSLPQMDFPPLPDIVSKRLQVMAKTHPSTFLATQPGVLTSAEGMEGYGKLAHVGDSLVGAVVGLIASDEYPKLNKGAATKLKSMCVNNELFAKLSDKYDLGSPLIAGTHQERVIRSNNIVRASIFEARIAATYCDFLESEVPGMYATDSARSNGDGSVKNKSGKTVDHEVRDPPLPTLTPLTGRTKGAAFDYLCVWLVPLFQPIVRHAYDAMHTAVVKSSSLSLKPEVSLSEAVARLHIATQKYRLPNPSYTYGSELNVAGMWVAECTIKWHDGQLHSGTGTGHNKATAKVEASYNVAKEVGLV